MANNIVNIFTFGDFEVSPTGDIVVNNGVPSILNGSELAQQEIRLLFRNVININKYRGYSTSGVEGSILGDMIQEDISAAISNNDILKDIGLKSDVYPMPDGSIKIDLYYADDMDQILPIDSQTIDFSEGSISNIEYEAQSISSVYDTSSDAILQIEPFYLDDAATVFNIKHPPVTGDTVYIISPDDYTIEEIGTDLVRTITEVVTDHFISEFDPIYLDDIFPTLTDGNNMYNIDIQDIYISDDDGNVITYERNKTELTLLSYLNQNKTIYVTMNYVMSKSSSTNYTIEIYENVTPENIRVIFPYSRLLGKVTVVADTLLPAGQYVAIYNRYPLK